MLLKPVSSDDPVVEILDNSVKWSSLTFTVSPWTVSQ